MSVLPFPIAAKGEGGKGGPPPVILSIAQCLSEMWKKKILPETTSTSLTEITSMYRFPCTSHEQGMFIVSGTCVPPDKCKAT